MTTQASPNRSIITIKYIFSLLEDAVEIPILSKIGLWKLDRGKYAHCPSPKRCYRAYCRRRVFISALQARPRSCKNQNCSIAFISDFFFLKKNMQNTYNTRYVIHVNHLSTRHHWYNYIILFYISMWTIYDVRGPDREYII